MMYWLRVFALCIIIHSCTSAGPYYFGPSGSNGNGLFSNSAWPIQYLNTKDLSNSIGGTYNISITLASTTTGNVTLTSYLSQTVNLYCNTSSIIDINSKSNITIQNINFVSAPLGNPLVNLVAVPYAVVQGCNFQGSSIYALYMDRDTDYGSVLNNTFNGTLTGIHMDGSDYALVEGNHFTNYNTAIEVVLGVEFNVYRRNTFQYCGTSLYFDPEDSLEVNHTLIEQNYFMNCSSQFYVASSNLVIRDNVFLDLRIHMQAKSSASSLSSPNNTKIYDNVFVQKSFGAVEYDTEIPFPGWVDIRNNIMVGFNPSIDINLHPLANFNDSNTFSVYGWGIYGNCMGNIRVQQEDIYNVQNTSHTWILNNTHYSTDPNITSFGTFPIQATVENACIATRMPLAMALIQSNTNAVYMDDATPFFANDDIQIDGIVYHIDAISSDWTQVKVNGSVGPWIVKMPVYRVGSIISAKSYISLGTTTTSSSTSSGSGNSGDTAGSNGGALRLVIIIVVGVAVIAGVSALVFVLVRRRKRSQQSRKDSVELSPKKDEEASIVMQTVPASGHYSSSIGTEHKSGHSSVNSNMKQTSNTNTEITVIGSHEIRILQTLGEGRFGAVYKGLFNEVTQVALKKLKMENKSMEFSREASLLMKLRHLNIIMFHGIWKSPDGGEYMVFEYANKGSLLDFLQQQDDTADVILRALQIASGMQYLESKGIIHRDLAARNILVKEEDGGYTLKISDFGLSRETNNSIYQANDNELPVRWTAPEALVYNKHSHKSDVWSYGIVLWELFEYGKLPYAKFTNALTRQKVMEGYRLECPANCPAEVYQIMSSCWQEKPQNRPTFNSIRQFFASKIASPATPQTDTTSKPSSTPYNFYHNDMATYNTTQ